MDSKPVIFIPKSETDSLPGNLHDYIHEVQSQTPPEFEEAQKVQFEGIDSVYCIVEKDFCLEEDYGLVKELFSQF